jgi:hypothetical protein
METFPITGFLDFVKYNNQSAPVTDLDLTDKVLPNLRMERDLVSKISYLCARSLEY